MNSQNRTLFLYDLINKDTISPLIESIVTINEYDEDKQIPIEKREPIKLYINSYGGTIYDALSGCSAIVSSKTPIYGICYGYAFSAGLTLFVACHKRFGGKYSSYMIHDPSEEIGKDKLYVLEDRIKELRRKKQIRTDFIISRTLLRQQDFDMHRYDDWFFDVNTALELGIVHEIV